MDMDRQQKLKEVREAIDAGNRVRSFLHEARTEMDSAASFGFADMMGLDLIGGIGKHMKIGKAKMRIQDAQDAMIRFRKEVIDIHEVFDLRIDIGEFMGFADMLIDGLGGLFLDYMVQRRIDEGRREIDNALWKMNSAIEKLTELEMKLIREE